MVGWPGRAGGSRAGCRGGRARCRKGTCVLLGARWWFLVAGRAAPGTHVAVYLSVWCRRRCSVRGLLVLERVSVGKLPKMGQHFVPLSLFKYYGES